MAVSYYSKMHWPTVAIFLKYGLINFQDYLPILLIYLRELAKDKR